MPFFIDCLGFPGGSDGKEFACNAGAPGWIPGLGRFPGEGSDNPLQYSSLENAMDGGAWRAAVHGVAKSRTRLSGYQSLTHSPDPWSSMLLPHHQPMRRKSHTLQPSHRKPLGISGGFEHEPLALLAWPCNKPSSAPYHNMLAVGFTLP